MQQSIHTFLSLGIISLLVFLSGCIKDEVIMEPQDQPCQNTPTIFYEGKTYHTIQIGTQCWLKENLDVGTMIKGSIDQKDNNIIEKYCFGNDSSNCSAYGGLYQWAEAVQYKNGATYSTSPNPAFSGNVQGICPNGWHIPTNKELQLLGLSVSYQSNAIIAQGTKYGSGTNTSGFSALFAGHTFADRNFVYLDFATGFWSATVYTDYSTMQAYNMYLYYNHSDIYIGDYYKFYAFSVRCLKD